MAQKEHCAVRLDEADIARVDALAKAMSTQHVTVTRSGALRALACAALPQLEKAYKVAPTVDMSDPMRAKKGRAGK